MHQSTLPLLVKSLQRFLSHAIACGTEKEIIENSPGLSHPYIAQLPFAKEGTTSIDVSGFDAFFSHSPPNIC